jgi:hypothetical protein
MWSEFEIAQRTKSASCLRNSTTCLVWSQERRGPLRQVWRAFLYAERSVTCPGKPEEEAGMGKQFKTKTNLQLWTWLPTGPTRDQVRGEFLVS